MTEGDRRLFECKLEFADGENVALTDVGVITRCVKDFHAVRRDITATVAVCAAGGLLAVRLSCAAVVHGAGKFAWQL